MLVKYAYLSGASLNNVVLDFAKMFCNTPIANLSVACDTANSSIIYNTIASNWELYDTAVAGTAVVRSLNADGSTYKYVKLAIVGNTLAITAYESWNATTHVGTNPACGGNLNASITATTVKTLATGAMSANGTTTNSAGALYAYATSRTLVVQAAMLISEFTRSSIALDTTYPCVTLFSTNGLAGLCRIKNPITTGDLTSSLTGLAQTFVMTPSGWIEQSSLYQGYISATPINLRDTNNQPVAQLEPLYVQANAIMLGKLYELKCLTTGQLTLSYLDEFVASGTTYIAMNGVSGGALCFCVPKG